MSKIVITFVTLLLIIVAAVVIYTQKAPISTSFLSNPSISPSQNNALSRYEDLLLINKNFKNSTGGMDNYFLVTEKGDIVKQLVPPPAQLGRAGTGRITPDFKHFVYNSWDSPPPPPGCGANATSSAAMQIDLHCPQGKYGLIIKNLDSKDEQNSLADEHYIYNPDEYGTSYPYISSDSAKIAYSNQNATFIYDISSQESKQIAPFSAYESIIWFPDSSKILISDGKNNYVYKLDTGGLTRVSSSTIPTNIMTKFADVSSDGKYIIALESDGYYLMNADGTNPKRLVNVPQSYYFSGFLKGGHKAIFSQYIPTSPNQQNTLPTDKSVVYLLDADTGEITPLLSGSNILFTLSPSGDHIAYIDTFVTPKNYKLLDVKSGKSKPFLEAQDNPDPASENIVTIVDWK